MAKPKITIVGLGLIGNSIGLGLTQSKRDFEVVGHDKDSGAAGIAQKQKAVDKTDWNLIGACDGADLVILALPVMSIRATLKAIANELKPGCVVMDTASIKTPVLQWAQELLPATAHYVGTNPIISPEETGGEAARADLFERAIWAICSSPDTHESGIKMAADLAERLGAQPLFLDPVEHDGIMAAVEHLPAMVSTALLSSSISLPTWREMRKLAGGQFESSTRLTSADPSVVRDAVLANRDNLSYWIDAFIENLRAWQELVMAGDEERLGEAIKTAYDSRARWEKERRTGYYDEGEPEMPAKRTMLMDLLGLGRLAERRQKAKD